MGRCLVIDSSVFFIYFSWFTRGKDIFRTLSNIHDGNFWKMVRYIFLQKKRHSIIHVWQDPIYVSCWSKMRCFARFGTICTILKTWKTPIEECFPATLQKITLLYGCFSCFLNSIDGTKSRNASKISLFLNQTEYY